ncbi:hypothetical protein HGRIS_007922 [Hohenbuehelia grisea]|uniref:Protein kinase domain-containing protein n=1 Tax=Hohenbuehelia grisea TaxID=104357 RepID=A0ABR3J6C2_9AGAR
MVDDGETYSLPDFEVLSSDQNTSHGRISDSNHYDHLQDKGQSDKMRTLKDKAQIYQRRLTALLVLTIICAFIALFAKPYGFPSLFLTLLISVEYVALRASLRRSTAGVTQSSGAHSQVSSKELEADRDLERQPLLLGKTDATSPAQPSSDIHTTTSDLQSSSSPATDVLVPLKKCQETTWYCDWAQGAPSNFSPPEMLAHRSEWRGKNLVAVKTLKCADAAERRLRVEVVADLKRNSVHPHIVTLHHFFSPSDSYDVVLLSEAMEGNLYHLIKCRKGRPFASGVVSSIFRQILLGLQHFHDHGHALRALIPEYILVTTTGLQDYATTPSDNTSIKPPTIRDIVVSIKLTDLGLLHRLWTHVNDLPSITIPSWYQPPEATLLIEQYTPAMDMWSAAVIFAEVVNLAPLFPGTDLIDQLEKIYDILGDPLKDYRSKDGKLIGGGRWPRCLAIAANARYTFPKRRPVDIATLFSADVPSSLVQLITAVLRFDPDARLTATQCLNHPYFQISPPYGDATSVLGNTL